MNKLEAFLCITKFVKGTLILSINNRGNVDRMKTQIEDEENTIIGNVNRNNVNRDQVNQGNNVHQILKMSSMSIIL